MRAFLNAMMSGIFNLLKSPAIMTLGGLLLVYGAVIAILHENRDIEIKIKAAESAYRFGETSKTVYAREKAFNEALQSFSSLEQDYYPEYGTGRLYYDIGNTYYQLGQYPFAVLYYSTAKNLMPRETVIERNLELTRKKIAVSSPPPKNIFISPPPYISLPEYLQIFSLLALFGFGFYSVWIWTGSRLFQNLGFVNFAIGIIVLIHLILIRYLAPVEAVMVHAAELRRDAGIEFAKVGISPVPAGTTVYVLGVSSNQSEGEQWVKVSLPGGEFGFVPQTSLRKI